MNSGQFYDLIIQIIQKNRNQNETRNFSVLPLFYFSDRTITWGSDPATGLKIPSVCQVDPTMKTLLVDATQSAFTPNKLDLKTMNIAHVFPCGQMKVLIGKIHDAWSPANRQKLYEFVNWLFTIDTEAVVQGKYLTGKSDHKSFKGKQHMYQKTISCTIHRLMKPTFCQKVIQPIY